ncbi:RNA polymerase sigma factor [Amnibacterium setariae]|uniref:Sigma-70 family RNA polymerase sigma factor n=1 Tax=Amnibacterium setariae TaxID=2306585 RepID=A0A3A1U9C8_9MICO|nr:sigma-70 family RNA polymerase sigma factor [Amnibacterium setariae]RIX29966.1 sigma-70 family RNA polymerase sigma factor [Amnibacterium setariae]
MTDTWSADPRYTDLVRRRGGELLRAAAMLTGSRHDAEDALQEAYIAVSRSWPTRLFGSESAAFAYLRTAVLRKSIDLIRKRHPSDDLLERTVEDRGLLRFEEDQAFFARLQHLPQQQRAVLVLRYYLDLDDRRIAELLDITRATVRSNAMRGLDKLRAETRAVAEKR